MDKYTTIQGDTFDLIAFKLWQNEKQMHHLLAANPQYQHIVFFSAGIELKVPDLPATRSNQGLPTWQR